MADMTKINLHIETPVYEELRTLAYEERTTLSALVRGAIDAYLHQAKAPKKAVSKRAR